MRRQLRPSQVFGRPDDPSATALLDPPKGSPPTRRRPPRWALALAAVVTLAVGGLLAAPQPLDPLTGRPQVVDLSNVDQAVAVLAVYGAEAAVVEEARGTADIYAVPGPGDAAARLTAHGEEIGLLLATARAQSGVHALAAAYANAGAHDELRHSVEQAATVARELALLAAAHDSVYGGAGAVTALEVQQGLTSLLGTAAGVRAVWAQALLEQTDGVDRRVQAEQARSEAAVQWAARVRGLNVAAEPALRDYVAALPDALRDRLEQHPVAAPALARIGTQG